MKSFFLFCPWRISALLGACLAVPMALHIMEIEAMYGSPATVSVIHNVTSNSPGPNATGRSSGWNRDHPYATTKKHLSRDAFKAAFYDLGKPESVMKTVAKKYDPTVNQSLPSLSRQRSNTALMQAFPLTGAVPNDLRKRYGAQTLFTESDPNSDEYQQAVDLYRQGVLQGQGNGHMDLSGALNRAEATKLLAYAMEVTLVNPLHPRYADVPRSDWFFSYVEALSATGTLQGYADGTFRPGASISYAEGIKLAVLAAEVSVSKTSDVEWYAPYLNAAKRTNILPEKWSDMPLNQGLTRGQFVQLLGRALRAHDMGLGNYIEKVTFSIPQTNVQDITASSSLLTDSSVWLTDLTVTGAAYYFDPVLNRWTVWAHSSIWPDDPTPVGAVLAPVLEDHILTSGDQFSLVVAGEKQTYAVVEKRLVEYTNAAALTDPNPEIDLILFTCGTDLRYRMLVTMTRID